MSKFLRRVSISALVAADLLLPATAREAGPDQTKATSGQKTAEYQAVERVINNVFGWAVAKDFDLFFESIADDSNFVAVTPFQMVKFGIDAVKRDTAFWASPDFKAISHEIRDLRITFSQSGDVAWFYCVLDDFNEWKGQPANWENVRWTGVLEKRSGKWRLAQHHLSFPQK